MLWLAWLLGTWSVDGLAGERPGQRMARLICDLDKDRLGWSTRSLLDQENRKPSKQKWLIQNLKLPLFWDFRGETAVSGWVRKRDLAFESSWLDLHAPSSYHCSQISYGAKSFGEGVSKCAFVSDASWFVFVLQIKSEFQAISEIFSQCIYPPPPSQSKTKVASLTKSNAIKTCCAPCTSQPFEL